MKTHLSFFSDRKKEFTNPGCRYRPRYSARYDDDGVLVLDEVGTDDVYLDIQSFLDSVEIHSLIRRYKAGDLDVFDRVQGFYADATKVPDTYVGILNKIQEAKDFFASLPTDIKEAYGNDFSRFIADCDTGQLMRDLFSDNLSDEVEPEPVDEPKKTARKKSTKAVETVENEGE